MRAPTETNPVEWKVMKCDFCGACVGVCPTDAITLWEADLEIDEERCTRCMRCVKICPYRALAYREDQEKTKHQVPEASLPGQQSALAKIWDDPEECTELL